MRFLRYGRRWSWAGIAALALGGCGIILSVPPVICPTVAVVAEAADMTRFAIGGGRDVVDVGYVVQFSDVEWSCDLDGSILEVDLTVFVAATAGPTSQARTADFEYFVALAARGGGVLVKETFPSRIALTSDDGTGRISEEIEQRIPLRADQSGDDFEILIGFQLTREQLEYNRARGIR